MQKKPYLKKNEVLLLSPNFKPTSNQTKMQKLKKKHFLSIILNVRKPEKNKKKRNKH